MATSGREALLLTLPLADAERALDDVLTERGFERTMLRPPRPGDSIARSDARYFDADSLQSALTLVREWSGYSDATPWSAALELAEGLPAAARMEMALPPAVSVLARALSRRTTVIGFAARDKPWHLVGVAFREGRATDVITAVKDRIMIGAQGQPRTTTPKDARAQLDEWLRAYGVSPGSTEIVLGDRNLPSTWRLTYLHS